MASEPDDDIMSATDQLHANAPTFVPRESWSDEDQNRDPQEHRPADLQDPNLSPPFPHPDDVPVIPTDMPWNMNPNFIIPGPHTAPFAIDHPFPYPVFVQYVPYPVYQPMPVMSVTPPSWAFGKAVKRQERLEAAWRARNKFDFFFGTDPKNLQAWQDICFICGRDPKSMPRSVKACRRWLNEVYVNIFDFVEAAVLYTTVEPRFDCAEDLDCYTRQTDQMCPSIVARGNSIFGFMLRKLAVRDIGNN